MDEMYDKLNAEAGDAIREFMLPDSASAALNELGMSEEEMLEKAAYDCVDLLESLRKRKKEREAGVLPLTGKSGNTSASSASASALINSRQDDDEDDALLDADSISEDEYMEARAHSAMLVLSKDNNIVRMQELASLMREEGIALIHRDCFVMMHVANNLKHYALAEEFFRQTTASGLGLEELVPDMPMWEQLVRARGHREGADAAIKLIDRLQSTGLMLTTPMMNVVLSLLVRAKDVDAVNEWWHRMHLEGIALDVQSFTMMVKHCHLTRQSERAFFLHDEMRARRVKADVHFFTTLFRACAEAPMFVHGYEDTVFDAMALMEGAELKPTVEVYNSIIYAFARPGDAVAAEYYFWEMQRKGITPTRTTYNSLLTAYARSQSVGLKEFGIQGRFVRRDPVLSPETRAIRDIGPEAMHEISKTMNMTMMMMRIVPMM